MDKPSKSRLAELQRRASSIGAQEDRELERENGAGMIEVGAHDIALQPDWLRDRIRNANRAQIGETVRRILEQRRALTADVLLLHQLLDATHERHPTFGADLAPEFERLLSIVEWLDGTPPDAESQPGADRGA